MLCVGLCCIKDGGACFRIACFWTFLGCMCADLIGILYVYMTLDIGSNDYCTKKTCTIIDANVYPPKTKCGDSFDECVDEYKGAVTIYLIICALSQIV